MVQGRTYPGPCPTPLPTRTNTTQPTAGPTPTPTKGCMVQEESISTWQGPLNGTVGFWIDDSNWDNGAPLVGWGARVEQGRTTSISLESRRAEASRLQVFSKASPLMITGKLKIQGSVNFGHSCPTPSPSASPTLNPTESHVPTPEPTVIPVPAPTSTPTPAPTITPSLGPTHYETPCGGIRVNESQRILDNFAVNVGFECTPWDNPWTWTPVAPHVGDSVVITPEDEPAIACVSVSTRSQVVRASRIAIGSSTGDASDSKVIVLSKSRPLSSGLSSDRIHIVGNGGLVVKGSVYSEPCPTPTPSVGEQPTPEPTSSPTLSCVFSEEVTSTWVSNNSSSASWNDPMNWDEEEPTLGVGAVVVTTQKKQLAQAVIDERGAEASRLTVYFTEGTASVSIPSTGRIVVRGSVDVTNDCPTSIPTGAPSQVPTLSVLPSALPSTAPSPLPTVVPSSEPTAVPSFDPTFYETPCDGIRLNTTRRALDSLAADIGLQCMSWHHPSTWTSTEVPHLGDDVVVSSADGAATQCVVVSERLPQSLASRLAVGAFVPDTFVTDDSSQPVRVAVLGKSRSQCGARAVASSLCCVLSDRQASSHGDHPQHPVPHSSADNLQWELPFSSSHSCPNARLRRLLGAMDQLNQPNSELEC